MKKWLKAIIGVAVIGLIAVALLPQLKPVKPKGCFLFEDGTLQGWTLDQLYDTDDASKNLQSGKPSTPASPGYFSGTPFVLGNSQKLALEAAAPIVVITDPNAPLIDIYFQSPDLAKTSEWQNIKGYSFDAHRKYTAMVNRPDSYFVQFQLQVTDKATGQGRLLAEKTSSGDFRFHEIEYDKPYSLKWEGAGLANYEINKVRVRATMLGYNGSLEGAPRGSWLIGNVCPIH